MRRTFNLNLFNMTTTISTRPVNLGDSIYPILSALGGMKIPTKDLGTILQVDWMSFGKKDSHVYRKMLMERFNKAMLSAEEKFMIYFLFSVVKNQKRVKEGLDNLPENVRNLTWFTRVRAFVDGHLCQYVSQATSTKKFPAVNIPVTNPGMDLLCWAIWAPCSQMNLREFFRRPNSAQLFLDEMAQSQAKTGYAYYWNTVVQGTQNPDAKTLDLPKPQMREEYYKNAESDRYPLVGTTLTIIPVPTNGYSTADLTHWMYRVKFGLKLGKVAWFTDNTYRLVEETRSPDRLENFSHFIDDFDELMREISLTQAKTGTPTTQKRPAVAPSTSSASVKTSQTPASTSTASAKK